MNDSEVELLILHPEWELTNHPECVSHDNLSSHLFQELSKAKAAFVAERAQAEEELGRVRAQVRLEEVSSNFGHLPTHNLSFQRWSGERASPQAVLFFPHPPLCLWLAGRVIYSELWGKAERGWTPPTQLSSCCQCVWESLNLVHGLITVDFPETL